MSPMSTYLRHFRDCNQEKRLVFVKNAPKKTEMFTRILDKRMFSVYNKKRHIVSIYRTADKLRIKK